MQLQLNRYPLVEQSQSAWAWMTFLSNLQRSPHTLDAYARDLQDYLAFCQENQLVVEVMKKEQFALYVRHMAERSRPPKQNLVTLTPTTGLSNATMQRRITVIRLYYDYLVEEGLCARNPVRRGRYTPSNVFGGVRERGLLRHYKKLPWIPNEEEWQIILQATMAEPLRNRLMFALAYDGALRREELCRLATSDVEPGKRLIHLRAETTKNGKARIVSYSEPTAQLYAMYLVERRTLSRERGPIFLSTSKRNQAKPISKWTWSKAVSQISARAHIPEFTTHTLRHLRLTDLARANWDLREIADYAGHSSLETTRIYIQLSGQEIADKVQASMTSLHLWRTKMLVEG